MQFLPDNVVSDLKDFMFQNGLNGVYNYHYTMIMKDEEGNYSFHDRPNQPCIGGNLRKYGASHGEECTRPKDLCPSDLQNHMGNTSQRSGRDSRGVPIWRFPDDIPSGVGYYTGFGEQQTEYVHLCYSKDSPWLKGFGSPEAVEFLYSKNSSEKKIDGVIIKTGDLDPTVLIHLQKHLQNGYTTIFNTAIQKGFTSKEALALTIFTYAQQPYYDPKTGVRELNRPMFSPVGEYSCDPRSSVKRIMNQEPLDLTGGLWSDRYDYHRPDLALVFRDRGKDNLNFIKVVNDEAHEKKEDLYTVALRTIRKELET